MFQCDSLRSSILLIYSCLIFICLEISGDSLFGKNNKKLSLKKICPGLAWNHVPFWGKKKFCVYVCFELKGTNIKSVSKEG